MLIMSIDPGTDKMGISLISVDEEDFRGEVILSHTHRASRMLHRYPQLLLEVGELTTRLEAHHDNLKEQVLFYRPDVIVAESPFFNPRRPSSAEPLARLKQVITEVGIETFTPVEWIAPQQMKKVIGANFHKEAKDSIREAIRQLFDEGMLWMSPEMEDVILDELDEHSVDSLGVGYAYATLCNLQEQER